MTQDNFPFDDKIHWYKDAIIYELHIKAFRDGDGDGIGDFQGLLEKLDYLKDLGVTAIWVLPFYPSPLKDDGYDIADYYSINPSYGDIDQLRRVLDEAHKRNLKVITELVINHCSSQHPWFQRARKAPKDSVERNYFVWTDDPNQYRDVRIIFQDFEASNWTWDEVAQQYYWHRFFHHQPDLNFDSPAVQEEVFRILDFWCNMGVDGFRLDAVPYLFEREHTNGENLPETHAYLKRLRQHVDTHFPGTVFLAEANMWPEDSASYFGDGDECHMNYHFPVMPRMFMALQMEDRYPITDIFDQTPEIPDTCQWAIFLRNHDELTLEMVTDEERDYMYKVYAKDPKAKINLGIRHRLAPLMENNRRKIELMNVLLFSLKGTPVIYYGDEIGMGDNFYLGDRDGVRTPMQWSPDRNGGFSSANPQKLYLPLILDPEYHYDSVNVETQRANPSSLLWFMKQIIQTRKRFKAFGRGTMKFVSVDNPKILAFTRSSEEETLLVVVNLSRYAQAAQLEMPEFKGYIPVEVFSKNNFPVIREEGNYSLTIGPYGYYWFELEKTQAAIDGPHRMHELRVAEWDHLTFHTVLEEITNKVLPDYLQAINWFEGKHRDVHSIFIAEHFHLYSEQQKVLLLLLDVVYESGLSETYQLPVVFLSSDLALRYADEYPKSLICKLRIGESEGYLLDAYFHNEFQLTLLRYFGENRSLQWGVHEIVFQAYDTVSKYIRHTPEIRPRVLPVDDTNTSIGYDTGFFLKLYRRVDRTTNPDLEITRFLTEQVNLEQVPDYMGSFQWKSQKGPMILGMLQIQAEYHGNGRSYMLERLNNYHERIVAREVHPVLSLLGSLTDPVPYEQLPEDVREFVGGSVAEGTRLLGLRTADMHKALASDSTLKEFYPEEFSLHYQRSLFSGLQSQVRKAFQSIDRNITRMPEGLQPELKALSVSREEVLQKLRRIYQKKLDVVKTRVHGNYDLKQVIFTGKDLAILDFHGDPMRTYSERRLKRSPLLDVAGMIRSIHYVAYEGLLLGLDDPSQKRAMRPFARFWTHYVTMLFMDVYLANTRGKAFIPAEKEDLTIMLETFLFEKTLYSLEYELINRPKWAEVPLRILQWLTEKEERIDIFQAI